VCAPRDRGIGRSSIVNDITAVCRIAGRDRTRVNKAIYSGANRGLRKHAGGCDIVVEIFLPPLTLTFGEVVNNTDPVHRFLRAIRVTVRSRVEFDGQTVEFDRRRARIARENTNRMASINEHTNQPTSNEPGAADDKHRWSYLCSWHGNGNAPLTRRANLRRSGDGLAQADDVRTQASVVTRIDLQYAACIEGSNTAKDTFFEWIGIWPLGKRRLEAAKSVMACLPAQGGARSFSRFKGIKDRIVGYSAVAPTDVTPEI
jgi:hypothetical protein